MKESKHIYIYIIFLGFYQQMKQLTLLVGFIVCVSVGTVFSETSFEFPIEECAGIILDNYVDCIGALASSIRKIHQWSEDTPITICGKTCTGNLKGHLSKWEWVWDAKFHCQDIAQGIYGRGSAPGRDSTMQKAIEDWITKASAAGKINANDFKC